VRKVIVSNLISLDGFIAGPNGEIDWHRVDEEHNEYAADMLNSVDTLLFGRVTYQLMASYWPTPPAIKEDAIIAGKMNSLAKIVFSTTLERVDWKNSRLLKGNMVEEVTKLKQQPGKDMMIFGSSSIVSALTPPGLIDEYRLIVNPVILGSGTPEFTGIKDRLHLQLLEARAFRIGTVLLRYQLNKQRPA
jgi:dihydrofolate reductase